MTEQEEFEAPNNVSDQPFRNPETKREEQPGGLVKTPAATPNDEVDGTSPEKDDGETSMESDPLAVPDAIPLEEKIDALASKVDDLTERLCAVQDGATALQKAVTDFYTQTTDSMHKELEKYRKGLVRKLEQELFCELIDLYDAADRAVARVAEDPTRAASLLEGIRDQIDAALFNRGVEKREATVGE